MTDWQKVAQDLEAENALREFGMEVARQVYGVEGNDFELAEIVNEVMKK